MAAGALCRNGLRGRLAGVARKKHASDCAWEWALGVDRMLEANLWSGLIAVCGVVGTLGVALVRELGPWLRDWMYTLMPPRSEPRAASGRELDGEKLPRFSIKKAEAEQIDQD